MYLFGHFREREGGGHWKETSFGVDLRPFTPTVCSLFSSFTNRATCSGWDSRRYSCRHREWKKKDLEPYLSSFSFLEQLDSGQFQINIISPTSPPPLHFSPTNVGTARYEREINRTGSIIIMTVDVLSSLIHWRNNPTFILKKRSFLPVKSAQCYIIWGEAWAYTHFYLGRGERTNIFHAWLSSSIDIDQ